MHHVIRLQFNEFYLIDERVPQVCGLNFLLLFSFFLRPALFIIRDLVFIFRVTWWLWRLVGWFFSAFVARINL